MYIEWTSSGYLSENLILSPVSNQLIIITSTRAKLFEEKQHDQTVDQTVPTAILNSNKITFRR